MIDLGSRTLDAGKLVDILLDQGWHQHCRIISDYRAPFANPDTKTQVVVRYNDGLTAIHTRRFLRYSKGPKQASFWDCYGDDFQSVELAIIALSRAPCPIRVN